jgi:transposase
MKTPTSSSLSADDYRTLSTDDLVALLNEKDQQLAAAQHQLSESKNHISDKERYIRILEEYLRLANAKQYGVSSEKLDFQVDLFDEAELEVALAEFETQLPEEDLITPPAKQTRRRGFAENLNRVRIELPLSDEEKAGAQSTFFTKVKEELEFIPAQLNVLEYWQEKAVFPQDDGADKVVAATRPTHPLGKCFASTSLLAHIITAKYADGLPLYRQEGILKRYGGDVSRSCMANWIVRLEEVFKPLLKLVREVQNDSDYLQADETRMQVLKEPGKRAQSDKWMWVIRGGPPDKPSVLFDYDPSRAGSVPVRLLDGFSGVLQADGYSGYGQVCTQNGIKRIGCLDHARRKFVEAVKASEPAKQKKRKGNRQKQMSHSARSASFIT